MFKIKRGYKLELQTHEAMKLFGSTKKYRQSKSDLVKHELRVAGCELRVTSYELKTRKHELKFNSASSNPRVTRSNPRV